MLHTFFHNFFVVLNVKIPLHLVGRLVSAAFIAIAAPAGALAQAVTYASSASGDDANNCTRSQPCATLQRAVDVVAIGGKVLILDSGHYGVAPLQISKSVSIIAEGVAASIRGTSILSPLSIVALHGLHFDGRGAPGGTSGIEILDASAVYVERCRIDRFPRDGIQINAMNTALFVSDSNISHNGRFGLLFLGAGTSTLTVDNSLFDNNGRHGLRVADTASSLTRTVISANAEFGVALTGGTMNATWVTAAANGSGGFDVARNSELTLVSSVVRGNGLGLGVITRTRGTARLAQSLITGYEFGVFNGATVLSRGNNTITGNTNNVYANPIDPLPAR